MYGGVLISNISGWSNCIWEGSFENGGGVGLAVRKRRSCIVRSSASASGEDVPLDGDELAVGAGSGALLDTESGGSQYSSNMQGHISRKRLLRFALLGAAGLFTNVASSNGLHLKFFLYPPHVTLRLSHCWQDGFVSSHFNRFALHVVHPETRSAYLPSIPLVTPAIRDVPNAPTYHFDSWIAWAL
jgi:hypothetical protein